MMETVLDVGLNAETVEGLIRLTGNPRLAWDSYRRLVQGYAEVVANFPTAPFDALVAAALERAEAETERELDHRDLRALTPAMLECYRTLAGRAFPADPHEQLAARGRGRVPLLGCAEGGQLSPLERHQRRGRHGGDGADHGVRQCRRHVRRGGRLSPAIPQPARGSCISTSSSTAQGEDVVAGRQKLRDNERLAPCAARRLGRLNDICHELEVLFARRAGFRVHRAIRHTVPAADAPGQAHRLGGARDRRGHG